MTHNSLWQIRLRSLRQQPHQAGNYAILRTYWSIGQLLCEEEQPDAEALEQLAQQLLPEWGTTYRAGQLQAMQDFYQAFPDWGSVSLELTWSHYRLLLPLSFEQRQFYFQETMTNQWSTRQLRRQIQTHFYERTQLTHSSDKRDIIRDTYILEFLDLDQHPAYREQDLEEALLDRIQDFLLELGKGFSFVARQKRIVTESGKQFYIDLVLYNYHIRCFVLLELKIGELNPRDIGQMDTYVRLFDQKWRSDHDCPTLGIILCSAKDQTVVRYSMLHKHPQLFAAVYQLHLPQDQDWPV